MRSGNLKTLKKSLLPRRLGCIGFDWLLVLAGLGAQTLASPIQPGNMVPWVPGVTVGVQGIIPARTNLIDVTRAPYSADSTGTADATTAIQAAINAAASNDVVYLPAGTYSLRTGGLVLNTSATLRGAGTSITKIVGLAYAYPLTVGNSLLSPSQGNSFLIASGATKGSTNFTLTSSLSQFGTPPTPGDIYMVSTRNSSDRMPVFSVFGYDGVIKQPVCIASVNGANVTITAPLVWDFTNSPSIVQFNNGGITGYRPVTWAGVENLTITLTNNGEMGSATRIIGMYGLRNCWVQGCNVAVANNYNLEIVGCINCEISSNVVKGASSTGSNHGGLLVANDSGILIQNNIFQDGLFPAIEFNDGFCGNAFFANFFTNNMSDVGSHNVHPMMNLFEANNIQGSVETDGYFGSVSHQALFRNNIGSPYIPVLFKRWSTYMQVVGNVLGSPGNTYSNYTSEVNGAGWMIFQLGFPNIGNNSYSGTTPPAPWNFPGMVFTDAYGVTRPNGIFSFTNTQVNTTNLIGNFTNIPAPIPGVYALLFQDNVNTNLYYPTNGVPVTAFAAGTSSNLFLSAPFTVSNGWTVFMAGQNAYQQLQSTDKYTDTITGNFDYFHNTVTWDTNGVQTIPISLLYTNGAPSWWGTNRWPAIDPVASTIQTPIPALLRYLGLPNGTNTTANVSPPTGLRVIAVSWQ